MSDQSIVEWLNRKADEHEKFYPSDTLHGKLREAVAHIEDQAKRIRALDRIIWSAAGAIDDLANAMPPPNEYTPRFMGIAISLRDSAARVVNEPNGADARDARRNRPTADSAMPIAAAPSRVTATESRIIAEEAAARIGQPAAYSPVPGPPVNPRDAQPAS